MTEQQHSLPKWILIVTALFALMELGAGLTLWFIPVSMLDELDMNATGVDRLTKLWAVRQLALGVILAYAVIQRSRPMIQLSFIFLLVMFIGDLVIGIMQQENAVIISAAVMCLIAVAMLWTINRK